MREAIQDETLPKNQSLPRHDYNIAEEQPGQIFETDPKNSARRVPVLSQDVDIPL